MVEVNKRFGLCGVTPTKTAHYANNVLFRGRAPPYRGGQKAYSFLTQGAERFHHILCALDAALGACGGIGVAA